MSTEIKYDQTNEVKLTEASQNTLEDLPKSATPDSSGCHSKLNKEKISVNKNIGAKASKPKSTPPLIKDNQVKKSAIKEIVKEKKPKKDIPLRAKNDPRQKS